MLTLLNTSIITSYGLFAYTPCALEEVKQMLTSGYDTRRAKFADLRSVILHHDDARTWQPPVQSAIGHQATADILTDLLGIQVPVSRIEYRQQPGNLALVFKLRARAPEGKILTRNEIDAIGYDFGLLLRVE